MLLTQVIKDAYATWGQLQSKQSYLEQRPIIEEFNNRFHFSSPEIINYRVGFSLKHPSIGISANLKGQNSESIFNFSTIYSLVYHTLKLSEIRIKGEMGTFPSAAGIDSLIGFRSISYNLPKWQYAPTGASDQNSSGLQIWCRNLGNTLNPFSSVMIQISWWEDRWNDVCLKAASELGFTLSTTLYESELEILLQKVESKYGTAQKEMIQKKFGRNTAIESISAITFQDKQHQYLADFSSRELERVRQEYAIDLLQVHPYKLLIQTVSNYAAGTIFQRLKERIKQSLAEPIFNGWFNIDKRRFNLFRLPHPAVLQRSGFTPHSYSFQDNFPKQFQEDAKSYNSIEYYPVDSNFPVHIGLHINLKHPSMMEVQQRIFSELGGNYRRT